MPPDLTHEYLSSQHLSDDFGERFESFVFRNTYDGGCHLWCGAASGNGYGSIAQGSPFKKRISSHVASWILNRGPIPIGLWVLHNCPLGDNRLCVNPNHLWLGTVQENNADIKKKGVGAFGERSGASKLTWKDVCEIRNLCDEGTSKMDIAERFGVKVYCIFKIAARTRWNHPHLFR